MHPSFGRLGPLVLLLLTAPPVAMSSSSTAFTYQGRLTHAGAPADGEFDLEFRLFDQLGVQLAGPLCRDNVFVSDGVFSVQLDFGPVFDGTPLELEIAVRAGGSPGDCDSGAYTTLSPRQSLTSAPYAQYAHAGAWPWQRTGDTVHYSAGDVGIGTDSPAGRLHVLQPDQLGAETLDQQQIQGNLGLDPELDWWQSFTAGLAGRLTRVEIRWHTTTPTFPALVRIHAGEGTGGPVLYEATYTFGGAGGTVIPLVIPAADAPLVSPGQQYTIWFDDGNWVPSCTLGDVYAGGRNSEMFGGWDIELWFRTYVSPVIAPGTQLVVGPGGNVGIGTAAPQHPLHMASGAHVTAGGTWTNASDRALKTDFAPVDVQDVLRRVAELPLSTWSYRSEPPQVRHLGPMAQDFAAAFELGASDTAIATIDADGVALAAIQALVARLEAQEKELAALRARLERLEASRAEADDARR